MALIKFWKRLGLKHTVSNSLTRGAFIPCFMCHCSNSGGQAQCSRFLVRWNLKTQTPPQYFDVEKILAVAVEFKDPAATT